MLKMMTRNQSLPSRMNYRNSNSDSKRAKGFGKICPEGRRESSKKLNYPPIIDGSTACPKSISIRRANRLLN
jgi:hypothetical protein